MAAAALLQIENIGKRFGTVIALNSVSLTVNRGEVVALLGDNGAGKSTLVKVISGNLTPDTGQVRFDGQRVKLNSPHDAKALGIETVYQDLSLCLNADVVANFFMGRERVRKRFGITVLQEREMQTETEQALADIGSRIPSVRSLVAHLSGGQRQAIELCRFVHWGGRLVLLDEPFAALGVEQTRRGLALIQRVKQRGIAVMVITHNMLHAFQVADRVVIMRQGQVVSNQATVDTSPEQVINMMTDDLAL